VPAVTQITTCNNQSWLFEQAELSNRALLMAYFITIRTVLTMMLIMFHTQMPTDVIVPQLGTSCPTTEEEGHHALQRVNDAESAIHRSAILGDWARCLGGTNG
jgi:hypothetical protein